MLNSVSIKTPGLFAAADFPFGVSFLITTALFLYETLCASKKIPNNNP